MLAGVASKHWSEREFLVGNIGSLDSDTEYMGVGYIIAMDEKTNVEWLLRGLGIHITNQLSRGNCGNGITSQVLYPVT
jgi:hypothetical protein